MLALPYVFAGVSSDFSAVRVAAESTIIIAVFIASTNCGNVSSSCGNNRRKISFFSSTVLVRKMYAGKFNPTLMLQFYFLIQ